VAWAGKPGDRFHKVEGGGWCRAEDNVKKARAR
jgi:hypothetical protein